MHTCVHDLLLFLSAVDLSSCDEDEEENYRDMRWAQNAVRFLRSCS